MFLSEPESTRIYPKQNISTVAQYLATDAIFIVFCETLAKLSYFNLRPNLRPTTLFSRSGKVISAKVYLLKWLGCSLGRRLGHSNLTSLLCLSNKP